MKHECSYTQYNQKFFCYSSQDGKKLMLTLNDEEKDVNKTGIDNFVCIVKYCPFCGYKVKVENDDKEEIL